MKSTLPNMVLVLFTITLIASASVAGIKILTEEPIAAAKENAKKEALAEVLPAFDEVSEPEKLTIDALDVEVYTATNSGEVIGYAVDTATKNGFSGLIRLMVGISPDGKVLNVNVLSHAETPGLGSKMTEENNPLLLSVKDKNVNEMTYQVKKDNSNADFDALTAATITSRAYADAMQRAQKAFNQITEEAEKGADNE